MTRRCRLSRTPLAIALVCAAVCEPGDTASRARAYEPSATHPGLTALATLRSQRLHRFLRGDCGLPAGLFDQLALDPGQINRRELALLRRDFDRLDPAGGYRPIDDRLHAAGWLLAGSVLADVPASANRHHFYSPALRRGLDDRRPLLSGLLALLATTEGGDSVRQLLTASGFDLTGRSALQWLEDADNPQSVDRFFAHLLASQSAATDPVRRHHLARALLALGGLLNVLQDMAVPSHVRNDYVGGRTSRAGGSVFDRGSPYERWVSDVFGQFGLPPHRGEPVSFTRLRDFFSNDQQTGLADVTFPAHFSAGTLPPPVTLPHPQPGELHQRLNAKLPFDRPRLGPIPLGRCATSGRTCYLRNEHGPMLAYRVDPRRNQLRFFLDQRCFDATARHLLPLAVGYSAGLIDHLLRGRLALQRDGEHVVLRNRGPRLTSATVRLLWDDATATRRPILRSPVSSLRRDADEQLLARATLPRVAIDRGRRLVALVDGRDEHGERLVAVTTLSLEPPGPSDRPPSPSPRQQPLWNEEPAVTR